MTIQHDGHLDGRPFRVLRDAETGAPVKLACLECGGEFAERDRFVGHDCDEMKARRRAGGRTRPARTEAAAAASDETDDSDAAPAAHAEA